MRASMALTHVSRICSSRDFSFAVGLPKRGRSYCEREVEEVPPGRWKAVGGFALPSMSAALVSSMGMVGLRVGGGTEGTVGDGVSGRDRHVASKAVDV